MTSDRFVKLTATLSIFAPIGCVILFAGKHFDSAHSSIIVALILNALFDLITGTMLAALSLMRAAKEGIKTYRWMAIAALVVNVGLFGAVFMLAQPDSAPIIGPSASPTP